MADSASFLVDEVLPKAPYRQWTLSLPKHIRFKLMVDGKLLSKVFSAFLRIVFSWQRRHAKKQGIIEPLTGGVSLLQRFGSLLQINPHTHSWLPDGVFYRDGNEQMRFHYLPPPTPSEIEVLLAKIRRRILKLCDREIREPGEDQMALVHAQAQAQALDSPLKLIFYESDESKPQGLTAFDKGFSLHAGLAVEAKKRKQLEKLLRYGMRPPFSKKRLLMTPDGRVRLKLRKPYYTGQTGITFLPVDFLRRLMPQFPIRVVMVSSLTQRGKQITMEALEAGAIDFVSKPSTDLARGLKGMMAELCTKIKIASTANVSQWKNKRADQYGQPSVIIAKMIYVNVYTYFAGQLPGENNIEYEKLPPYVCSDDDTVNTRGYVYIHGFGGLNEDTEKLLKEIIGDDEKNRGFYTFKYDGTKDVIRAKTN